MRSTQSSRKTRTLAAAAGLALTAALVAGCSDDDPTATDPGPDDPTSSATESSPTESASPTGEPTGEPTETPTDDAGDTTAVPVYYVLDGPRGPFLVREFHRVDAEDYLTAAAAELLAGAPQDPDYTTLWPQGSFQRVSLNEETNTIDVHLTDDAWTTAPDGMSRRQARMAAQQLVYTLQGAAQTRVPVKVFVGNGRQAGPLLGLDTSAGLRNADPLRTLHLVNVTSPAEGETVADTFTAKGVASSFEATVPWEVRQGEEVVLDGFTTAEGWIDKLYPWEAEVDVSGLEPGEYTFVAMTDDPSGGAEGPGPSEDTKTIVVE